MAGVPGIPHNRHRFSQPQQFGFAAAAGSRQPCGVRCDVRVRVLDDAAAGTSVHPAASRATGPQRSSGVLRTAWRNRRFEQEDPALVHLHRCRCPGRRHSEDRVFRQLDDLFERTLPIPPGHRFHHGKPDGIGNPRILAECRRRRGRHQSGLFEEGRCLRRMVPGAAGGQTRPGLPRHHEAPQQEHARGRSGPPRNPG